MVWPVKVNRTETTNMMETLTLRNNINAAADAGGTKATKRRRRICHDSNINWKRRRRKLYFRSSSSSSSSSSGFVFVAFGFIIFIAAVSLPDDALAAFVPPATSPIRTASTGIKETATRRRMKKITTTNTRSRHPSLVRCFSSTTTPLTTQQHTGNREYSDPNDDNDAKRIAASEATAASSTVANNHNNETEEQQLPLPELMMIGPEEDETAAAAAAAATTTTTTTLADHLSSSTTARKEKQQHNLITTAIPKREHNSVDTKTKTITSTGGNDDGDNDNAISNSNNNLLWSKIQTKMGKIDDDRFTLVPAYKTGEIDRLFSAVTYSNSNNNDNDDDNSSSSTVMVQHKAGSVKAGILLIAGSFPWTVGLLALPTQVAQVGFVPNTAAMLVAYGYMLCSGLWIAELSLNRMALKGRSQVSLLELLDDNDSPRLPKKLSWIGTASTLWLQNALLVSYATVGYRLVDALWGTGGGEGDYSSLLPITLTDWSVLWDGSIQHPESFLSCFPLLFLSLTYQWSVPRMVAEMEGNRSKIITSLVAGTLLPVLVYTVWTATCVVASTTATTTTMSDTVAAAAATTAIDPLSYLLLSNDRNLALKATAVLAVASGAVATGRGLFESWDHTLTKLFANHPSTKTTANVDQQKQQKTSNTKLQQEKLQQRLKDPFGIYDNRNNDEDSNETGTNAWVRRVGMLSLVLGPALTLSAGHNNNYNGHDPLFADALQYGGLWGSTFLFLVLVPAMVWNERYGVRRTDIPHEQEQDPLVAYPPFVPFGKIPLASSYKAALTFLVEQGAEKIGIVDAVKNFFFMD